MDDVQFDLSPVSTDDLIRELKSRYPHGVFSGVREALGNPGHEEHLCRWFGSTTMVLGMLDLCAQRVMDDVIGEA